MHSNSGRGVFAGLHPSTADTPGGPDSLQLCVFGLPASLVVDGDAAAAAEAGHGLQAWDLDPDALVDRFDARLLLHTWPPPTPQPLVVHDTAASEAQVDHERYRDWHAATAAAADAEDGESAPGAPATAVHLCWLCYALRWAGATCAPLSCKVLPQLLLQALGATARRSMT
jgi:hypothetical protein